MVERLTYSLGNGDAYYWYEDHSGGWRPTDEQGRKALDRLAEFEDAEEKGLLVRPPCKVGDTVWLQDIFTKDIIKGTVRDILCTSSRDAQWKLVCDGWAIKVEGGALSHLFKFEDFGEKVFIIREEAERKLSEVTDAKK